MNIQVTYGQSTSTLPAGFVAAVQYVVNLYDTTFTNNVTLNILVNYGSLSSLGQSNVNLYSTNYNDLRTALTAENAPGASTLPITTPFGGRTLDVAPAELKALGIAVPGQTGAFDGTTTFSNTANWSYSATATPAANQYYFVGTVEHEFSEVMGRTSDLTTSTLYEPLDLYRYQASGALQTNAGGPSYFSLNGGTTNLDNFNNVTIDSTGDLGDWAASAAPDSFLDQSSAGIINGLTQTDIEEMQSLGWTTASSVPQWQTISVLSNVYASDTLQEGDPAVTALSNGSFIVAWDAYPLSNSAGRTIYDLKFNANGTLAGSAAPNIANRTGIMAVPTLATFSTDQSLMGFGLTSGSGQSIELLDSNGVMTAPSVQGLAASPSQIVSINGSTAVVLSPNAPFTGNSFLQAQYINSSLATSSAAFTVVTLQQNGFASIDAAAASSNTTAFVWEQGGGHSATVWFQLASGTTPLGSPTEIGNATDAATNSDVIGKIVATSLSGGGFAVAYTDGSTWGTSSNITLRIYNSSGGAVGQPIWISSGTAAGTDNIDPSITQLSDGTIVVGWTQDRAFNYFVSAVNLSGQFVAPTLKYSGNFGAITALPNDRLAVVTTGPGNSTGTKVESTVLQFSPSVFPDAVVSAIAPKSSSVMQGNSLSFTYTIKNIGTGTANAGSVGIFLDQQTTQLSSVATGSLTANTSQTLTSSVSTTGLSLGTHTLWIETNPGGTVAQGQNWNSSTFSVVLNTGSAPTLSVSNDLTAARGQTVSLSNLVSISDPNTVGYQKLELWDTNGNPASGQFFVGGVAQSGGEIDVALANVAGTTFHVGTAGGSDSLLARLLQNDGTLTAWQPFTVMAPVNQAPVVTATSVTATHGQTSVAASSLFSVADADGDSITTYALNDATGSGHFVVGGVTQGTAVEIDLTAAQLASTAYQFGSATDQLYARANDGALWGSWQPFTASPFADHAPVVSASNAAVATGHSVAASNLFSLTDADGDTITTYAVYDATGSGHFAVNGVTQGTAVEIDLTAAQLALTSYVAGTATDQLYARANDGTLWSAWQPFTAGPTAPVVSASNVTAFHNQSFAASNLFTASDPDGDTLTTYALYDATGNGHFVVGGVTQGTAVEFDLTAAQLAQTVYQSGSGSDQLYIRANDGTLWSTWQPFMVTAPADHAPVVNTTNIAAAHNQSLAASSLFSVTDADGDTMTTWAFYDATGNGRFVVNGVTQGTAVEIDLTAAQLAQTVYQSGSGSDQLYVRANDGTLWSNWQPFTLTAPLNQAPVVTAANTAVASGHSIAASLLFTSSDPNGDTITTYALYDATGSGHFAVNGVTKPGGTEIDLTAAQLAQTTYIAGSTTDQLYARANDGTLWGNWQPFSAGPVPPVVTAGNTAIANGHSVAASLLVTASDPDGGTLTTYALYDATGSGHFAVNGVTKPGGTEIDLTAAQLAQTSYVAGSTTDQLYARANDGLAWSAWQPFLAGPVPPVVTAANAAIASGHSVAASSLFMASDPDGGTITTYALYDLTGSGHFVVNGVTQASGTEIDLTAARLAQTTYVAGSATDQLYARANDGSAWSSWQPFTAGPVPPVLTAANLLTVTGQVLAASSLFTSSDPDGGTLTTYALYDATGNGHFAVNGVTQASGTEIDLTAAQLAQTTYVAGNGTDQLYARANNGTAWSAWQPFTATGETPAIINAGATLELGSAYAGAVTFFGTTGTLKLDNSSTFNGTVAGMTANDAIDFGDINFATAVVTSHFTNSSGGTFSVTDGTHTANIALLGNYLASTFVASSDGHGGTSVIDPPANQNNPLAQAQHA